MPPPPSFKSEWRSPKRGGTLSFADEQHTPSEKENATHGQVYRTGRTRVKPHDRDDGPSGRRLRSQVVETNAGALIQVLRGIPGSRHL